VLTRYVTAQPAPWSGEVAAIAFAWLIFLGASVGFKRGMHVSIDALMRILPQSIRRPLAAMVDLLVLAFCLYVTWLAIGFTVRTWDNPTSVLRLPQSVTYAAPAVGFAFMTLRYGALAWGRWRGRPAFEEG
jgi:TRAP-type C4-dicarboxylate transport system permease small subunit